MAAVPDQDGGFIVYQVSPQHRTGKQQNSDGSDGSNGGGGNGSGNGNGNGSGNGNNGGSNGGNNGTTENGGEEGGDYTTNHIPWYSRINPLAIMHRKRMNKVKLREILMTKGPPKLMVQWSNIEFKVKVASSASRLPIFGKKEVRTILYPQSGYVAPGHLTAIMGPSGCGKTSLLNIISQRVKKYSGDVMVNGKLAGKNLGGLLGFVQQDDVFIPNLTVYETLKYSAYLRLPSKMSLKEKKARVEEVIKDLNLNKCRDTFVGQPGVKKGISGGERKRLAIAVELLTSPSVLFLDEPTTGLDASAALHLMYLLKKVASKGRTIVLTIHQPRTNIFNMFDRLILLVSGRLVYFGEACAAISYFGKLGLTMPSNYNPADFLIDILSVTESEDELSEEERASDEKRLDTIISNYQPNIHEDFEITEEMKHIDFRLFVGYASTWFTQFVVLCVRAVKVIRRDTMLTLVRFVQTTILAVIVGLIFLQLGHSQVNVQDRAGVLFFVMLNQMMNSLMSGITLFADERPVFLRERASRAYHVSSYFAGKSLSQLPQSIIYPLLFGCIVYYMIGLNSSAASFFKFLALLVYASYASGAIGEAVSACTKTTQMAQSVAILLIIVLVLFSGFYVNTDSLPVFLTWGPWASPFRYVYEAFFLNEFVGTTWQCNPDEACRFRTGQDVLNAFHFNTSVSEIWIDCLFLLAFILVAKTATYLALVFLNKPKGA